MAKQVIFDEKQLRMGKKQGLSTYQPQQQPGSDAESMEAIRKMLTPQEQKKLELKAKKEAYKKNLEKKAEEKLNNSSENAKKQAKEEIQKEISNNERKLDVLVKKSSQVLLNVKSVFPFDLFPDNLTIDSNKVNVVTKAFFASGRVHSIYIEDVYDVFVEAGPIFATLKIVDKGFVENLVEVKYLKKNEAYKARRIIQGLVVAVKDKIDLAGLEGEDFARKIEELGKATEAKL